eukprot:TRINITY_DN8816_c0_g1_i5.p1 TRINITY_DN8816_c0_g1~~TRINITY_DN8816_c0_g1_i5.p1  ORF type:complete len:571 (+),score=87.66 TRINITY_DN8816_c0_g1_i5:494-2206(+)
MMSVTYKLGCPTARNISMTIPHVPGSPYITLNVTGQFFNLTSESGIISINGQKVFPGQVLTGKRFEFVIDQSNPRTWVMYSLNGVLQLNVSFGKEPLSQTVLLNMLSYRTSYQILRFACLSKSTTASVLDQYKDVFPIATSVKTVFTCGGHVCDNIQSGMNVMHENLEGGRILLENSADKAQILFNWIAVNASGIQNPNVLMLALPHHVDCLDLKSVGTVVSDGDFVTFKGSMKGYVSSQWILMENLTSIGFEAPSPIDPSYSDTLLDALEKDIMTLSTPSVDTYGYGKYIGQLARLVLICDQLLGINNPNCAIALTNLTNKLSPWLYRVTYRATFLYDVTWGGTISAGGWLNATHDYGNGIYNDHHFHYGYYIYASSVVMKYIPTWEWSSRVLDLIRDIANPSTSDPYFPVTRHKDWYLGHSWAQGLDSTQDGKNQESTSEAVNAYYAISLYGKVTNNNYLTNIGKLLLATEIRSAQKYWQTTVFSTIYPRIFAQNGIVGIMWSDKADYATFFGNKPEFIHCIQMVPFTPISEQLLPLQWVEYEYGILQQALSDPVCFFFSPPPHFPSF